MDMRKGGMESYSAIRYISRPSRRTAAKPSEAGLGAGDTGLRGLDCTPVDIGSSGYESTGDNGEIIGQGQGCGNWFSERLRCGDAWFFRVW